MQLRLEDRRERDQRREQRIPLRIGSEIPFSIAALHAMRLGAQLPLGGPSRPAAVVPAEARSPPSFWTAAFGDSDPDEANKAARIARYEPEDRCERAFKCGQWFLLLLTIVFVSVVVTMLSMLSVQVGKVLDEVGGSTVSEKVDRVLDHAMQAALHTETATANAAEMSFLAKHAAREAHPRIIGALNRSTEIMDELADFSLHPQWTISAGATGRRRKT